jgi:hypothetical protein
MRRAPILTIVMVLLGGAVAAGAAPAAAATGGPATPQRLYATNDATSITLSWTEPTTGTRPAYFRVYESGAVVARNTTTHVTMPNLVFGSSHTYTVTAVDPAGLESAPSASISRSAFIGGPFGCGLTPPSNVVTTQVTASAVSVAWSNALPYWDEPGVLVVSLDGVTMETTSLDNARVSGLAPASTHTIGVARRDCSGTLHAAPPLSVTTAAGPAARPAAPSNLTVGARTNTSVALSWTAPSFGRDPVAGYAVYDGGALVSSTAATSATVTGLWRDTTHQFTVSALDAVGGESAQSAPAATTTLTCDTVVPAPIGLSVTPRSASTVALSWATIVQTTGFTVYRGGAQVATVDGTSAGGTAVVTGLASSSTATYTVAAQTAQCGSSGQSAGVSATTLSGPPARPAAPTGLSVTSTRTGSGNTGIVTLAWSQPSSVDAVASYRLYEGSTVLATSTTTGLSLTLPSGPTHAVSVVAVDSAGNESTLDGPVHFSVPFIPAP